MRVLSRSTLEKAWQRFSDVEEPLKAWFHEAKHGQWRTSADIKKRLRSASFVKNNRVIFNIKGNTYRLIVFVNYEAAIVYVKWFGTHAEYDSIDVNEVHNER